MARQLYGKNLQKMTLELNASDDRGISVVRQEIQDFASTKSVFSSTFKLIVLDDKRCAVCSASCDGKVCKV